ncbi:MAG: translation initiation factor IF-2 [Sulfurovum sp. AS07-7]|nr:MAG: translation initiation factor IF-2 [Sulfurovum sp. AS07-7]
MDKVKIQDVAAEVGLSNSEVLEKANELGFNVKAASSSISIKDAEVLFDYIVSGKLPNGFSKPVKEEPKQKKSAKSAKEKEVSIVAEPKDVTVKEKPKKAVKEGIKVTSKSGITTIEKKDSDILAGMTIVRQKSAAPATQQKVKTLDVSAAKKKKAKKPIVQKESGSKVEIGDRDFMGNGFELYDEEEVVLLDFSDKNIYEEMKRQEQRRKEEQNKRPIIFSKALGQQQSSLSRGGRKRKKYPRTEERAEKVTSIEIPENVRVYEFAEKIGKSVGEVVKVLFSLGTMVTKNDFLDKDSIEILSDEFEVEVTTINPLDALDYVGVYDSNKDVNPVERPPVITIMGHVDHGKTSLLDKIRSTKVAAREVGGITQHVGAYQIEKNGKKITFIDTPGHEAFTEMRSRGAQATDIVIIVVAADDGVMPQTKEAINHAKAAGVPIIVAINKMDKESANPDMVKAQLAELGITPIDWGGDYEFVPVSAHTGLGIEDLLDVILLQAEIMELKADPKRNAKAIVIESSVEKGFGPVANIIVKDGTLKVGDNVIVGKTYGRIKAIKLDTGVNAKEVGPSTPAAIVGLNEVPSAGEIMIAMDSEKEVRELSGKIAEYDRAKQLSRSTKASLDDLSALIAEGQLKALSVIVKTDVQGSLDAIKSSLEKLRNEEVKVNIVHEGVGSITESDVALAGAGEKILILGFNVKPNSSVKQKAKELGVDIRTYSIIYALLDDVRSILGGMMSPIISEEVVGTAEVKETFSVAKIGTIAGCKVNDGVVTRGSMAKVLRSGEEIYVGKIASLKRFSDDVREVKSGYECGIVLDGFNDIQVGDTIEVYKNVEEQASL